MKLFAVPFSSGRLATGAGRALGIERLSSGLRINHASDDAAGLAISDRMAAQIRSLRVAGRNATDGISLMQTAEGGLASIANNLQRLRELAVQAANGSNSSGDRASLQVEAAQLVSEIDRVAVQTQFNGAALLDGSFAASVLQIGAGSGADQRVNVPGLSSMRASVLGAATAPVLATTTVANASGLSAASSIDGPGQLVINGVDVFQGATIGADASLITAAINAVGIPGLSAVAAPNTVAGTWASTGESFTYLALNGQSMSFPLSGSRSSDLVPAMWLFNTYMPTLFPHLSATDNGNGITLTMANGANLTLGSASNPQGFFLGGVASGPSEAAPLTTYSTYSISYTGVAGLTISGSRVAALGLTPLTPPPAGSEPISTMDLSSVSGANAALASVDAALGTVDNGRALLGAAQNRLASIVNQIGTAGENASMARSRIVDADVAAETTYLVRDQILQSSVYAMAAQANTSASWVLGLLGRS